MVRVEISHQFDGSQEILELHSNYSSLNVLLFDHVAKNGYDKYILHKEDIISIRNFLNQVLKENAHVQTIE